MEPRKNLFSFALELISRTKEGEDDLVQRIHGPRQRRSSHAARWGSCPTYRRSSTTRTPPIFLPSGEAASMERGEAASMERGVAAAWSYPPLHDRERRTAWLAQ
jgi:hypothetical protein